MKKFLNEFKAFALKGNVISLAVGVMIGAAFQGVITSLTDNILSPFIGLFTGGNFNALNFKAFGATFTYGAFITSVLNFLIMAVVIFLLVKAMTKLMSIGKPPEPAPAPTPKCPYCMTGVHAEATRCPACTSEIRRIHCE